MDMVGHILKYFGLKDSSKLNGNVKLQQCTSNLTEYMPRLKLVIYCSIGPCNATKYMTPLQLVINRSIGPCRR